MTTAKTRRLPLFVFLFSLFALLPMTAQAETENWYTYWAFGTGTIKYPSSLSGTVDSLRDSPGVEATVYSGDFFGFYSPVDWAEQSIAGFVIHSDSERLESDLGWVQMNLYTYSFSFMRFYGTEPGDGFFLRGDAGFATGVVEYSDGSSTDFDETGFGLLFGVGYGFKVTEGTRILLTLSHAERDIDDEGFGATSLTVGGLF